MLKKSSEIPTGGKITEAGNSVNFLTGDWRAQRPVVDKKKCINCLMCYMYCPDSCVLVKEGKMEKFDYDFCKGCGICAKECPVNAITMVPEDDAK